MTTKRETVGNVPHVQAGISGIQIVSRFHKTARHLSNVLSWVTFEFFVKYLSLSDTIGSPLGIELQYSLKNLEFRGFIKHFYVYNINSNDSDPSGCNVEWKSWERKTYYYYFLYSQCEQYEQINCIVIIHIQSNWICLPTESGQEAMWRCAIYLNFT